MADIPEGMSLVGVVDSPDGPVEVYAGDAGAVRVTYPVGGTATVDDIDPAEVADAFPTEGS